MGGTQTITPKAIVRRSRATGVVPWTAPVLDVYDGGKIELSAPRGSADASVVHLMLAQIVAGYKITGRFARFAAHVHLHLSQCGNGGSQ